jgi:hypothetical protein
MARMAKSLATAADRRGSASMQLVGSWVGLLTGVLSMLAALFGMFNSRKIKTVHNLVNSITDRKDNRVTQLTETLTDAGVPVPPSPHVNVPGDTHD